MVSTLLIPQIALSAAIILGSPWTHEAPNHIEAQLIMETSVYKYNGFDVYAAHNYAHFKNLPEVRKNAVVIIDGVRFHVDRMGLIDALDTELLNAGPMLFTSVKDSSKRFAVFLR